MVLGRKGITAILDLIADWESSFNIDKSIEINFSLDLVLTQELDLNKTFGACSSLTDLELSSKINFVQISRFIIHY